MIFFVFFVFFVFLFTIITSFIICSILYGDKLKKFKSEINEVLESEIIKIYKNYYNKHDLFLKKLGEELSKENNVFAILLRYKKLEIENYSYFFKEGKSIKVLPEEYNIYNSMYNNYKAGQRKFIYEYKDDDFNFIVWKELI